MLSLLTFTLALTATLAGLAMLIAAVLAVEANRALMCVRAAAVRAAANLIIRAQWYPPAVGGEPTARVLHVDLVLAVLLLALRPISHPSGVGGDAAFPHALPLGSGLVGQGGQEEI